MMAHNKVDKWQLLVHDGEQHLPGDATGVRERPKQMPQLWVQSSNCPTKDSPAHSGPGTGLGSAHRVVWFLTTILTCSSAVLIYPPGQTLLLNTASLNISG